MKYTVRHTAVLLAVLFCIFAFSGCTEKFVEGTLVPNEYLLNEDGEGTLPGGVPRQYTEEDIREMNDGETYFVYSEPEDQKGEQLTFLRGKYYDEKIESVQDAVDSLDHMWSLLGFSQPVSLFSNYGERIGDYTYWVFQQKYGDSTVEYATIRIVTDADGYTVGLVSSLVPDLGLAEELKRITKEEAEQVVQNYLASVLEDEGVILYSDYTRSTIVEYSGDGLMHNAWVVYTSNPAVWSDGIFDMPYLAHVVSSEGEYLFASASTALTDTRENTDVYDTEGYFANLESAEWSGDVTLYDGSKRHITVDIAYDPENGRYYLADVNRKIMMADHTAFMYNYELDFISSEDNTWDDYRLMCLYNYERAYDWYADMGIKGPDGFGTPMLLLIDWKESSDPNAEDVNNACSYGFLYGWMAFGCSKIGDCEECLDVIAHEFTHGVTKTAMCGTKYMNETGAINESFSDIMGELCEHMTVREDGTPETDDAAWYHGQNKETPTRCISDPNQFDQPAFVGDVYYIQPTVSPDSINDQGGVHFNSSFLSYVAWKLYDAGMPLEDMRDLWFNCMSLMVPGSDYDDVLAALKMSLALQGFEDAAVWEQIIEETYEELGLVGDRTANAAEAVHEGCGRLTVTETIYAENSGYRTSCIYCVDEEGYITYLWLVPDESGRMTALLPAGYYTCILFVTSTDGSQVGRFYLQPSGSWSTDSSNNGWFEITSGETFTLPDITISSLG